MITHVHQTVSVLKACELAHVSRRTIYNWMNAGKVEFIRTAGGSRRILTDSLFRTATGEPLPATTAPEAVNA